MEDWNTFEARPAFSLFEEKSPEEEAKKSAFVDVIVYNRWSKQQRRLYQRLKTEHIVAQIAEEKIKTLDEIVDSLCHLQFFKTAEPAPDPEVDRLIGTLQNMKIQADISAKEEEKKKKELEEAKAKEEGSEGKKDETK